jgi:ArsR family transcriptional regulator
MLRSNILDKKLFKAFKAIGEPTRLKIIKMLAQSSFCVCELSEYLDMLQPRISQHLKILKDEGLVKENREGYWVYYSLNRETLHRLWYDFMAYLDTDLKIMDDFIDVIKRMDNSVCNQRISETKEKIKNQAQNKLNGEHNSQY